MLTNLETWIWMAGWGQLSMLVAAALVPFRLRWREALRTLPRLHQQMFLIYSGYIVLAIVGLSAITLTCASDLAAGTTLARAFCTYVAVFWGVRLMLQGFFDARPYLTTWWLRGGYHLLTVLFIAITTVFVIAALHPGPDNPWFCAVGLQ